MNLEDVVDPEYGLQQDKWSLTRPKFGKEGQLQVVGWGGKNSSNNKYYILFCSMCSKDTELFGDGYFKSEKGGLGKGQLPCGCAKILKWSKEQYAILCQRKARELGYKFLGFIGEWKGNRTKIKMLCEKHGEWESGIIHNLIHAGNGCLGCRAEVVRAIGEANRKSDDIMIESFFKTEAFHPDTNFWRSERKNSHGCKSYWFMSCPECGETGESFGSNLSKGQRSCACSIHRQQECYINQVIDDHGVVALKFGIANNSKQRMKQQSSKSIYTLKQHSVYTFRSVEECKKAERECKQELECGVVLKLDMPDGYTETTWVYNLEKIEEIYKRNGGVKII